MNAPAEKQTAPESRFDAAEMAQLYASIAQKSSEVLKQFAQRTGGADMPALNDELGISKAFFDAWARLLADPMRLADAQMKLWQDYWSLWQSSVLRLMGQPATPVAEAPRGDRRFKHEDWQSNFVYDYFKQSYLIAAKHLHQTLGSVQGLDEQTQKKVDF